MQAVLSREPLETGVPLGKELHQFVHAFLKGDADGVRVVTEQIRQEAGLPALIDVAAVLAFFNAINRVADATGVELDKRTVIPPELDLSYMQRLQ